MPSPRFLEKFYRLKSVDFNGELKYSDLESVQIKSKVVSHFKVYPNPAVFDTNVVLTAQVAAKAELQLFDLNGKLIRSQKLDIQNGFNKFRLDVSDLTAGNYLLKVASDQLNLPVSKLVVGS